MLKFVLKIFLICNIITPRLPFIAQRLRLLLILKQREATGISKREVSILVGVCSASAQKWRTLYIREGMVGLLKHNKIGFKPSVFTSEDRVKIEEKLNNPENGLHGYVELKEWIRKELGKDVLYRTVVNYCVTNFHSSVKVGRKSHRNKDVKKVADFKKNFGQVCKEIWAGKKQKYESLNLYFQDESRFGLMTKNGKSLTS